MTADASDPADARTLRVVLVAAVAANGVIGVEGGMPWHLPADLKHFKRTTVGHPVIMGRRTYESIADRLGGPLPDRLNVVLTTRDLDLPYGAVAVDSVDTALAVAAAADDEVYVVGGATVYEQFLSLADRLILTELHDAYEGDTYFPPYDSDDWQEVDRDEHDAFDFVTYDRA